MQIVRSNVLKRNERKQRLGNDDGMSCAREVVKLPRRNSSRHHCPHLSIIKLKNLKTDHKAQSKRQIGAGQWLEVALEIGSTVDLGCRLAGKGLRCWLAAGLELVQGYQACKEGREDAAGVFTYVLAGACAT